MKTLIIIRHAKSNQSFLGNDFERPLSERGRSDAPMMAERLLKKKITVDALLSSPATRAKKTAELFSEIFKKATEGIIFISSLYHAPTEVFYNVIAGLPEEFDSVALFSHNPGITHFVNSLQTNIQIDNMPTCGIFAVQADIVNWKDFIKPQKKFLFFDYPKLI